MHDFQDSLNEAINTALKEALAEAGTTIGKVVNLKLEEVYKKIDDLNLFINASNQIHLSFFALLCNMSPEFHDNLRALLKNPPPKDFENNPYYLQLVEICRGSLGRSAEDNLHQDPTWFQGVILGGRKGSDPGEFQ